MSQTFKVIERKKWKSRSDAKYLPHNHHSWRLQKCCFLPIHKQNERFQTLKLRKKKPLFKQTKNNWSIFYLFFVKKWTPIWSRKLKLFWIVFGRFLTSSFRLFFFCWLIICTKQTHTTATQEKKSERKRTAQQLKPLVWCDTQRRLCME